MNQWQHQTAAISFAAEKRGAGIFAGVGLGKTRIAIELLRLWQARKVLIVGPKAGLSVWTDQLPRWDSRLTPIITPADRPMEQRFRMAMQELNMLNGAPRALILNYEALWREPFKSWLESQLWDCIVCDEAHKLKTPGGKQSKFIARLGKLAKRRLALTGTPMAQSPLDAYALYRFLDSTVFGTSFAAFKSQYAIMDPVFPSRAQRFVRMDDFKQKFDSISYSVNAKQAGIWLPELIDIERTCVLSGEGRRVYDELAEQFCAQIRDGTVTPDNAAVRLLRLQQITSGHIRDDSQRLIDLDSPKAELLRAVLEELPQGEPVVVFCRFRPDLELVHRVAEALGRGSAELSGEKNELAEWQAVHHPAHAGDSGGGGKNELAEWHGVLCATADTLNDRSRNAPTILAVQIQAGSAAVDLSRARYAIYYSVGYSVLDFEQSGGYRESGGRLRRPNSAHQTVFNIHLIAKGTVDRRVYRALKEHKKVIEDIMAGVFRGESLDDEGGVLDVDPDTGEVVRI